MSAVPLKSALHKNDLNYHLHPQTELAQHELLGPHIFTEGNGIYVKDIEGREYIEGMAGLWCASLGFSETRLARAADNQLRKLPFYHNFAHRTTPVAVELAEQLVSIAPGSVSRAFFTNSGSEANDNMVKLVWYYNNVKGRTAKKKIISRHGAYHGITVAASSLTGMSYAHTFFDVPMDAVFHTDCPHRYHFAEAGESEEEFATRMVANIEKLIESEGPETVAAFIAEPVMGAGGVILPPATYFEKVQRLLRKHDILFVADEVICGFGRTGNMFGCDTFDITPDIVVVAKALSSGYIPIGALLISDEIYHTLVEGSRQVGTFGTGFTYSGHPVSCAVALETLKIYRDLNIVERVRDISPRFLSRLHQFNDHPLVGETRGVGLIGGIELVRDKTSKENFDPSMKVGALAANLALEQGIIVRALRNDTIAFCPPLIITIDEIKEMFDRFEKAMENLSSTVEGYA
ncbi:MAG: aminotransferase class III-fold pyridoxal phosphate-dependent enzyme [Gammaproteobacteria bacterium]|nr:aminotransferase class III-fold pyridoxal phosphate-dependent enzyme [Gammaproteobacteria bacterium]